MWLTCSLTVGERRRVRLTLTIVERRLDRAQLPMVVRGSG
jgi:hypothetical protein